MSDSRCGIHLARVPDGSWRIAGRLDPEVGAVLCRALEAAGEALRGREPAGEEGAPARRAGERLDVDWAFAVLGQRWAPEDVSAETPGVRRRRHPGERRPVATSRE